MINKVKYDKLSEILLGINRRNLEFIYENNPRRYFPLANDKSLMKEIFATKNIPIPQTYALISHMGEIQTHLDSLKEKETFVIKPSKGKQGNGILVLRKKSDSEWETPSGKTMNDADIRKHLADIIFGVYSFGLWDKAIVEQRVIPHPFFREIFSKGVSDIRVILLKDQPVLCMARIPTEKANGKANLHQGAIGVAIEIDSGKMLEGYDTTRYMKSHPDTGFAFYEKTIPFWKKILDISIMASEAVPLNYLGVDIVIDEKLGPMILEINARPGLEIQNVSKKGLLPLLQEIK